MDSRYLIQSVGDVLAAGLAEVAIKQPEDPISYLANYLISSHKREIALVELQSEKLELQRQISASDEEARLQQLLREEAETNAPE